MNEVKKIGVGIAKAAMYGFIFGAAQEAGKQGIEIITRQSEPAWWVIRYLRSD